MELCEFGCEIGPVTRYRRMSVRATTRDNWEGEPITLLQLSTPYSIPDRTIGMNLAHLHEMIEMCRDWLAKTQRQTGGQAFGQFGVDAILPIPEHHQATVARTLEFTRDYIKALVFGFDHPVDQVSFEIGIDLPTQRVTIQAWEMFTAVVKLPYGSLTFDVSHVPGWDENRSIERYLAQLAAKYAERRYDDVAWLAGRVADYRTDWPEAGPDDLHCTTHFDSPVRFSTSVALATCGSHMPTADEFTAITDAFGAGVAALAGARH